MGNFLFLIAGLWVLLSNNPIAAVTRVLLVLLLMVSLVTWIF